MASIRARKETGKLYFDFRAYGQRFREQTELTDTAANRKRMELVAGRMELEIRTGTFEYARYFPASSNLAKYSQLAKAIPSSVSSTANAVSNLAPRFDEFANLWFEENQVRWRRTTTGVMRMVVDGQLIPRFGATTVSDISRADILKFRAEFAEREGRRKGSKISPKSVNDTMGVLKAILDEAAARFGFATPAERIKRLKVPRSDVKPFTLEEAMKVCSAVREDYQAYLQVRMFSGLRTGEANGLRWKNVDFRNRQLLVRETFTHGEMDGVKTDGSWREVEMSAPIHDALIAHRPSHAKPDDLVFPNRLGEPMDNHNFTKRIWYPLLRYLNLERRRPYQMRHTAATLWLAAGENPTWIARQLGHSSLEMLFRTYARWVKDMTRRDGSAFDRMLREHETGVHSDAR